MKDFLLCGLLGPAGSGKDLVADWFARRGLSKAALADPMKRFAAAAFGFSRDDLWGPSERRNREFDVDAAWWYRAYQCLHDDARELRALCPNVLLDYPALHDWLAWLRATYPERISLRVVLQTLGTEWGRKVSPSLWLDHLHATVVPRLREGAAYSQVGGFSPYASNGDVVGAVVPDHRFSNEVAATRAAGGRVLRLRRRAQEQREVGIAGHVSEAEQRALPDALFDLVLEFGEFRPGPDGALEGFDQALVRLFGADGADFPLELRGQVVQVDP